MRHLSVILAVLSVLVLEACNGEGIYKIPIGHGERFTEETAIRVSRAALSKAGLDVSKLEPAPYRENAQSAERFLARNTINGDQGYMLWHEIGQRGLFQYSVAMKMTDEYVLCEVGRTK